MKCDTCDQPNVVFINGECYKCWNAKADPLSDWHAYLKSILPPQQPQKQYSTAEQLAELIPFAQRLGLYDAVDHLMKVTGQAGPLWGRQKVGEETV